jgi:asparagine synthase (glutamine-hydrolysing)
VCGVAGAWLAAGATQAPVERMMAALGHRGPDDSGSWAHPSIGVALGHRRLAILDPSAAGRQPMTGVGERFTVVYNGEIYNFRELRVELERAGATFATESDTEVLLAAWQHWGPSCVTRLRGMFAFGLWDDERREMTVVRDRLGIKPLYYAQVEAGFLFASEVRACLASGLVSRRVDRQAVWDYLAHGCVAEPHTILHDVRALPAAHLMRLRDGKVTVERYWDVADATATARSGGAPAYADAVNELRRQLEVAARFHLVSDVPVGAFLSGGIDSSAVVGLTAAVSSRPIRTFSVGFGGEHPSMDELKWARLAAARFGTDHTEVVLSGEIVDGLLDRAAAGLDQPSVDGSNTYIVSEAARRNVTVALSGLGGDELFAGYPHFARFARRPGNAANGARGLRNLVGERITSMLPGRVRYAIHERTDTPAERLASFRLLADERRRSSAVTREFRGSFEPATAAARTALLLRPELDPIAQVSYAELNGYLRDTLLRDADAMSMTHGLEIRPVLLDHELVEFAFSLPAEYKNSERPKRILVDALVDLLPTEIVSRPKTGFELPLGAWLQGPLRGRALALLGSPGALQLLSAAFRTRLRRQVEDGRGSSHQLWGVLILLAYLQIHDLQLDA